MMIDETLYSWIILSISPLKRVSDRDIHILEWVNIVASWWEKFWMCRDRLGLEEERQRKKSRMELR